MAHVIHQVPEGVSMLLEKSLWQCNSLGLTIGCVVLRQVQWFRTLLLKCVNKA